MGSPMGVTHSTVCPDWAMSLALSVSQCLRGGERGRKRLELVQAAADPAPSQHQQARPPAADWDSPAHTGEPGSALGTAPHPWAGTGGSSLGQGPAEAALPSELLAPLLYLWVDQQRKGRSERRLTWMSRVAENISLMPLNTCLTR